MLLIFVTPPDMKKEESRNIQEPGALDGINFEQNPVNAISTPPPLTQKPTTAKPLETGSPGLTAFHSAEEEKEKKSKSIFDPEDKKFIIIIAVAVSTGFIGLMFAGVCYYKFRKSAKAASDVEYPAYGVTGPMKERIPSPGDRKLAQSAQMYHYQHQKQQMIAMEKANGDMKHDASDDDSEEDNVEGDYTVYECPGLAPTGEMEVKNPLFRGDETPVTPGQDITGQPLGQEPPSADKENQ
ncbi:Neural proliferation differentiation and control protein 1 [Bulinus truncatus]|nr:Neural proliferation differentiation and control protein 1 [Bulinus truncatus]